MELPLYQFKKQQLSELTQAVTQISSCLDLQEISKTVTSRLVNLLQVDVCALAGWNHRTGQLEIWEVNVSRDLPDRERVLRSFSKFNCFQFQAVIQEGKSSQIQINSENCPSDLIELLKQQGIKSVLIVPVHSKGMFYGLMCAMHVDQIRKFRDEDIVLANLLASQSSVAIENARLYQSLKKHNDEMEAIHGVSLGLTGSLQLQEILNVILSSVLKFMNDAQDSHIFLYKEGKLEFGAAIWADGKVGIPFSNPRPQGLTYTVARQGKMVIVADTKKHALFQNYRWEWHGSIVGMPLKIGNEVVGVISIAWPHPREFKDSELRFLRLLGDHAALAIEKARLYEQISLQANTDPLTGLPNRRAFDQRLEEELRRASRYTHPFSLVMLDVDRFKRINDQYGHPAGDEVLKQFGELLRRSIRDTDFVARYGGDEFALIFPESGSAITQHLLLKLEYQIASAVFCLKIGEEFQLTATMGLATFPENGENGEVLIRAADQDMYREKARAAEKK